MRVLLVFYCQPAFFECLFEQCVPVSIHCNLLDLVVFHLFHAPVCDQVHINHRTWNNLEVFKFCLSYISQWELYGIDKWRICTDPCMLSPNPLTFISLSQNTGGCKVSHICIVNSNDCCLSSCIQCYPWNLVFQLFHCPTYIASS